MFGFQISLRAMISVLKSVAICLSCSKFLLSDLILRDMIEVLDKLIFAFMCLSSVQICVRGLNFSTLGVWDGGFIWGFNKGVV